MTSWTKRIQYIIEKTTPGLHIYILQDARGSVGLFNIWIHLQDQKATMLLVYIRNLNAENEGGGWF